MAITEKNILSEKGKKLDVKNALSKTTSDLKVATDCISWRDAINKKL